MKLPEIQRSIAQASATISPGQAAAPHLAKAKVIGAVAESALKIDEMINQNQVNKEMANYKDGVAKFENWMAIQREFDPKDLEDMGIADKIDMGSGGGPVPKSKVYAAAFIQFTSDLKEAFGGNISSARHKAAWDEEVDYITQPMVLDAIKKQEAMAIEEMQLEAADDYQMSVEARNYEGARHAIDRYPTFTPKQEQAKRDAISKLADSAYEWEMQDELTLALNNGDTEALDEMIAAHEGNELVKGSPWTDKEHNAWASKLKTAKRGLIEGGKISDEKANKKIRALEQHALNTFIAGGGVLDIVQLTEMSAAAAIRGDTTQVKYYKDAWDNHIANKGDGIYLPKETPESAVLFFSIMNKKPEDIGTFDLDGERTNLTKEQFGKALTYQTGERRKKDEKIPQTNEKDYGIAAAELLAGYPDANDVQKASLTADFREAVAYASADGPLTSVELRDIVDGMKIARMEPDKWGWFTGDELSVIAQVVKVGKKTQREATRIVDQITIDLIDNDETPTRDAIWEKYNERNKVTEPQ